MGYVLCFPNNEIYENLNSRYDLHCHCYWRHDFLLVFYCTHDSLSYPLRDMLSLTDENSSV